MEITTVLIRVSLQCRYNERDGVSKSLVARLFAQSFVQAQIKDKNVNMIPSPVMPTVCRELNFEFSKWQCDIIDAVISTKISVFDITCYAD